MHRLLTLLFLSALAFAQTTAPPPTPAAKPPAQPAVPAEQAEVAPAAAVITIDGVCDGKVPAAPAPDCKTVITRAQFEKLVDAIDPNLPPPRRQQLADVYARIIVLSDAAEQRGLAGTPEAQQVLNFTRMQTLTQLLLRDLQKEAASVPPAEIEKYYNEHAAQYEQATLQRIFIPKTPPGGENPTDEKTLLAEAGKIRAAAVAGGDFEKLQKQAYDDLGLKTPPPPTAAGTQRRSALPPSQAGVFDLQPGQISEVMNEPGGLYIFKLESKKKLPLAEVTPEITKTLEGERMKNAVDSLTRNVKPNLNQQYFGAAAVAAPAGRPLTTLPRRPPAAAPPSAPPPAKPPSQ